MKYLAKYRPVEAKIKEHDYVLWTKTSQKGTVVHLFDGSCIVEFPDNSTPTIDSADLRVLKLHLCSRDIKDEEKVYHDTLGPVYTGYISDKTGKMDVKKALDSEEDEEYSVDVQDLFKVIGEISPQATWVKEGDEFEQDQKKIIYDKRITNLDSHMDWTHAEYEQYIKWVEIKGPCGHFH